MSCFKYKIIFISIALLVLFLNSFSQNWSWQSGNIIVNQSPTYGTKGLASTSNDPGTRTDMVSWVDNAGLIWLFGGSNRTNTNIQYINTNPLLSVYNDIWKFDPTMKMWTWIKGDNILDQGGLYGDVGVEYISPYQPCSRKDVNSWNDKDGNLWIFGGYGNFSNYPVTKGLLADLWKYNVAHNSWTYQKGLIGINKSGDYGTAGIPAASNLPGGRSKSATWIDKNGILWM